MTVVRGAAIGCLLAGGLGSALAQPGIYTCVDAKGRKLTSDRPMLECIDREQKQISPSGTVIRRIGPSLTAEERAAEEEKQKRELEEKLRLEEEKRRDKALLARYPNRAPHDAERRTALAAVDDVIATAQKRIVDLRAERTKLKTEEDFYGKDPSKVPDKLKRLVAENEQNTAAQLRFISHQEDEKRRVNARFDDELKVLTRLWAAQGALPAQAAASATPRR
jgi:hypothetical protein